MKKIIIIDTYPDTDKKMNVLESCVKQLKNKGFDLMITSHLPIKEEIIKLVDFYIYDKENILLPEDLTPVFRHKADDFLVTIYDNGHLLTICKNIFNSINLCKNLGYQFFFFMEYDNILSEKDIQKLNHLQSRLIEERKKLFFFKYDLENELDRFRYETLIFGGFVEAFDVSLLPIQPEDLKKLKMRTLESIFYEIFTNKNEILTIEHKGYDLAAKHFFNQSQINIFSQTDSKCELVQDKYDQSVFIFIINKSDKILFIKEKKLTLEPHYWALLPYQGEEFILLQIEDDVIKKPLSFKSEINTIEFFNKFLNSEETKNKLVNSIKSTKLKKHLPKDQIEIIHHFVDGPFVEIKGNSSDTFKVQFKESNKTHFETELKTNMWAKCAVKYYKDWEINILKNAEPYYNYKINLENKRVLINLDSKSLGDTLAWMPYAEEFRKKHNCQVILSTFWNHFFIKKYPELNFVEPGEVVHNLTAMFNIGWFYDSDKEPQSPNTIPLQKAATNILGLEFREIIPKINFIPQKRPVEKKYVTLAKHSTAGLKYWNNLDGWQEVVDFLISKGLEVYSVSKEGCDIRGVKQIPNSDIYQTMNWIHHSEFFMGLSSGLSWLAWALRKKVVMISNFTTPDHEFQTDCIRIYDTSICNGCWNDPNFKFDKGDWNWCPKHKGTERQFECSKKITSQKVIETISKNLCIEST